MSGYAKCPKCNNYVTLKWDLSTKLNPFSPLKIAAKAISGNLDDQKAICPKCGYKGTYGEFEKVY